MKRNADIETLTVTRLEADEAVGWHRRDGNYRLEPGSLIPGTRFKILRWIGEGGMGQVFEAVHVDIERRVALKVLQFGLGLSPELTGQFLSEAQICAKIESRFVVEVMDFGELPDERPFFVMELLGRDTLHSALVPGPMSIERALPILRQCCKALAAIHEAGVVHRDIKPKNIVLQKEDGRADTVRVVDFGLAAGIGSTPRVSGTASYMAPEQILGKPFGGRVDIYALGCVAYEMLAGRPPLRRARGRRGDQGVQRPRRRAASSDHELAPELARRARSDLAALLGEATRAALGQRPRARGRARRAADLARLRHALGRLADADGRSGSPHPAGPGHAPRAPTLVLADHGRARRDADGRHDRRPAHCRSWQSRRGRRERRRARLERRTGGSAHRGADQPDPAVRVEGLLGVSGGR
ncbi:MAG: serine/threonine protein kinase [Deltaproteobacteria bacterium]|nr:serine/threonine protein kinase [Deltaproteobacteria bacterium]